MPTSWCSGRALRGWRARPISVTAGREPVVLEARSRIGGRIFTLHERGVALPIELGAEYVHGRPDELLSIARAAGLALYGVGISERWRWVGGRLRRFGSLDATLGPTFSRLSPRGQDTSVARALAQSGVSRERRINATKFVEGFEAAPPDEASARWVARERSGAREGADDMSRFAGGYDGVVHWLHARLGERKDALRTCSVVREVAWRRGRVVVHCHSPRGAALEPVEAEQVVVTLPLGVLRARADAPGGVRFDPPLPARTRKALAGLAMGQVVKLTLRFREVFWPADLGLLQARDQPMPTWFPPRPFRDARLTGWAGGRAAEALLAPGEEGLLDAAVVSLAAALRVSRALVESQLAGWWMHDWSADPFARGAYAHACVGGADAWRVLSTPIERTVFLAGEAISDAPQAATVHGAIASGRRAASAIVRGTAR